MNRKTILIVAACAVAVIALTILAIVATNSIGKTNGNKNIDSSVKAIAKTAATDFLNDYYTVDNGNLTKYADFMAANDALGQANKSGDTKNLEALSSSLMAAVADLNSGIIAKTTQNGYGEFLANRTYIRILQILADKNYTMRPGTVKLVETSYDNIQNRIQYVFTIDLIFVSDKDNSEQTFTEDGIIGLQKSDDPKSDDTWLVNSYKVTKPADFFMTQN
jgi:hypothetical protein